VPFLVGSAAALLIGEGVCRLLAFRLFDLANQNVRFDPETGWTRKEGLTSTATNEAGEVIRVEGNCQGIRLPSRPYRIGSARSVLVVGDSFTVGTQVRFEDTWTALLERRLVARYPAIRVVNAGVDGYDLGQEYRLARRLWDSFQPRILIVAVYIGNDLIDYEHDGNARPPWADPSVKGWLRDHSYLYHLLGGIKQKVGRLINRPVVARGIALPPEWAPMSVPSFAAMTEQQRERIRRQFLSPDLMPVLRRGEEGARRIESVKLVLDAFVVLATANCARVIVVLMPTKQQVLPAQRAEWLSLHRLSATEADFPQAQILAWGSQHGQTVVDVAPALAVSAQAERLFWRVDDHLSPAGHGVVADALYPVMDVALSRSPGLCEVGQ
jgi:hypothetical protein